MTNFESISPKAQKIVRNFIETIWANNISNDAVRILMVSLYNSMPFADGRIQIASANLRKLFVKAFYRCVKI